MGASAAVRQFMFGKTEGAPILAAYSELRQTAQNYSGLDNFMYEKKTSWYEMHISLLPRDQSCEGSSSFPSLNAKDCCGRDPVDFET